MMSKRFVLLDRDGTINVEREYLDNPDGVELLPNAVKGLRRMQEAGLGLVIVTNQSGIARGYFTLSQAHAVNDRLLSLLREDGVHIDGVYMCPHAPGAGCACRKPAPGMAYEAAKNLRFDLGDAFVVGDKAIDMAMGRRVGSTTIMVQTGYGLEQARDAAEDTDFCVDDLAAACRSIMPLLKPNRR